MALFYLTGRGKNLLIKEKNRYDCKFILILFRQTMTMFQTVASLGLLLVCEGSSEHSLFVQK